MSIPLRLGPLADRDMLTGAHERRRALLGRVSATGLDHVFVADHVSFHDGFGMDGLVQAATVLATEPRLEVQVGVYLLALRHPVTVARQISTLCESAPGRLVLGVGVGGEDRHEIEICGVDPATRGRRTDEALPALRALLAGGRVTQRGEFFAFDDARIRPAPDPPVPILVGGRSDAALRRTARHGDGWLGVWCSPSGYARALARIAADADRIGRTAPEWRHGLQLWIGVDRVESRARERLAAAMQAMYRIPFERFEKYCPWGEPARIADSLAGYVDAGCTSMNVMAVADSSEAAVDAVAELKQRLSD